MNTNPYSEFLVQFSFPDTGRGILTKKHLYPGDILIKLPESYLISANTISQSRIGAQLHQFCPMSMLDCLTLFLISEHLLGQKSPWYEYIRSLPPLTDLNLPIEADEDIVNELPDQVQSKYHQLQKRFADSVRTINICLKSLSLNSVSRTFIKWAWSCVNTRCLYKRPSAERYTWLDEKGDNCVLGIFIDLFNHSPFAKADASFNSSTRTYDIITQTEYPPNTQVFLSYGAYDNTDLFLEYGFIVPKNPYNCVSFDIDSVQKAAVANKISDMEHKLTIIQRNLGPLTCSMDGISYNLSVCLRIMAMAPHAVGQTWTSVLTGDTLNEDNEMSANHLLEYLIDSKLTYNLVKQKRVLKLESTLRKNILGLWLDEQRILEFCLKTLL